MSPNRFVHFEFPHRMNMDGTIDSICPRCFGTVGRSTWEADLDRMEAAHICDPARINSSNQHRRMPVVSERIAPAEVRVASAEMSDRAAAPGRTAWPRAGSAVRRSA